MKEEKIILPPINPTKSVEVISEFIKERIRESKTNGLVLGLSGGLDSSTAAYISTKALDKDKILGIVMPSATTSANDVEDALTIARNLQIKKEIIHIDNILEQFSEINVPNNSSNRLKLAKANLNARIRMMILYYHANSMNRLVLGTGNKSESLVGYFTKHGDGGVDILPLGDLYKTDVNQIATYLKVPYEIINKPPTAGLWHGQTDEKELGITYNLLDKILYLLADKHLKSQKVAKILKIPLEEVLRINNMMKNSEHKLAPPPMPQIRRK
ncbi:MAG: NAD+ synthase [Methanobacterium sp.]|nr:NAD+ synthase [Methanobacterium sp.]